MPGLKLIHVDNGAPTNTYLYTDLTSRYDKKAREVCGFLLYMSFISREMNKFPNNNIELKYICVYLISECLDTYEYGELI